MTQYCTTCGGRPHADGAEVAGPSGHPMTWGRLGMPEPLYAPPVEDETTPDGPIEIIEALPPTAPANARWAASVPAHRMSVVESRGIWKGREERVLGVAGICEDDVRFYASWKWSPSQQKWQSREHWLRVDGTGRKVAWKDLKGGLRERLGNV